MLGQEARETFVYFLFTRFCFAETAHHRTLSKRLWAGLRMNKGLIRNLWHHLPAPHSQKNRAQPNSVSRFCQNYFCSTLETSSGGSKAKTVNEHGWLSFTRFDLTPFIEMLQKLCCKQALTGIIMLDIFLTTKVVTK